MDKQKLIEWLDLQAELCEKTYDNSIFEKYKICSICPYDKSVHLVGGEIICKELNIQYTEKSFETKTSKARHISFEWNGIMFYSLENLTEKGEQ